MRKRVRASVLAAAVFAVSQKVGWAQSNPQWCCSTTGVDVPNISNLLSQYDVVPSNATNPLARVAYLSPDPKGHQANQLRLRRC
jgi:hypothetical protein